MTLEESEYIDEEMRPDLNTEYNNAYHAKTDNPEDHYQPGWDGSSGSDTFHSARSDLSEDSDESDDSHCPGTSTPLASGPALDLSTSPVRDGYAFDKLDASDHGFRNRRILYSSEEDLTPPPEPKSTCLGSWKQRKVVVIKYVDDNLQDVNFENAIRLNVLSEDIRVKRAIGSQNAFRHIVRRA